MRHGSLCTGYGGIDLALEQVLGATTAWVSDVDKGANKVLAHRYPGAPNIGDMTAVDWSQVEPVDILSGGTPCQDLSHAGRRRGMSEGTRSNLWVSMREAIAVIRPSLVIWENVRGAYSANADSEVEPCAGCVGDGSGRHLRALGRVLGDLADLGYDARWHGLRAADVGAPHGRFRVFVVAYPANLRHERFRLARGRWTGPADGGSGPVALLPTPESSDASGGRVSAERGGVRSSGAKRAVTLATAVHHDLLPTPRATGGTKGLPEPEPPLLPTPVTNDMGEGKTVEAWDDWTAKMKAKHGNGNGHGPSLAIEAARSEQQWGKYTDAIARWEHLTREAPAPTEPGRNGNPRLSPRFAEWLMGLPAGWITDVPDITRNEALRLAGNGVVPQQCAAALRLLLEMEAAA